MRQSGWIWVRIWIGTMLLLGGCGPLDESQKRYDEALPQRVIEAEKTGSLSPAATGAAEQVQRPVDETGIALAQRSGSGYIAPDAQNIAASVFDGSFEEDRGGVSLEGARVVRMQARTGTHALALAHEGDTLMLGEIPVEEGAWYVVTGYMRVPELPADVVRYYVEFMHGTEPVDIPNYPMVAVGRAGRWEPFVLPVYIKKDAGVTHVRLVFRNTGAPKTGAPRRGGVWLDDISMHRVRNGAALYGWEPPAAKAPFDGVLVRVDADGNFMLREGAGYRPFLPLIIYPGGPVREWGKYREKGFNTVICNSLDEARRAVSLGMHWIWSLYDYGIYDNDTAGFERFIREYREMRETMPELFSKLLWFYWDNERYHLYESVKRFSDAIKRLDVDASGRRYRPFLMQLDFATAAPHYHNGQESLVDLQGLYANPMVFEDNDPQNYDGVEFKGYYDGEFANFSIFSHVPGLTMPKTVFVINSPFGDKHLANSVFAAFARGGKAFAYWKDGGSQPPIESKPWWEGFDVKMKMFEALLPLLRSPDALSWELTATLPDDESGLVLGIKDFGAKRCMLYASRSDKAETVRFGGAAGAEGSAVLDYFTSERIARWHAGAFTLKLAPRDYGACCWSAPASE